MPANRLRIFLLFTNILPLFGQEESFTLNFTRYLPEMTLDTALIYKDCYNGRVSNVTFHKAFTYNEDTKCQVNPTPFIPVEWTSEVEKLLTYELVVEEEYSNCIAYNNCTDRVIDLAEWGSLAQDLYKACIYCVEYTNKTDNVRCAQFNSENRPTQLHNIIDTMFLYVEYRCSIPQDDDDARLVTVPITSPNQSALLSSIQLSRSQMECPHGHTIKVDRIVEQAASIRYQVNANNHQLVQHVQDFLNKAKSGELLLHETEFSIQGGYYWGDDGSGKRNPNCLLIHYHCAKLPAIILPTTNNHMHLSSSSGRSGLLSPSLKSRESLLTLVAGGIVGIVLLATVIAITFTIRRARKRRPMINTII